MWSFDSRTVPSGLYILMRTMPVSASAFMTSPSCAARSDEICPLAISSGVMFDCTNAVTSARSAANDALTAVLEMPSPTTVDSAIAVATTSTIVIR